MEFIINSHIDTAKKRGNKRKIMKIIPILIALAFIISCAATYTIDSLPTNATVSIDNAIMGETPFTNYEEKVWLGSKHKILLQKDGYQSKELTLKPTKWIGQRVVLGIIFPPALFWAQTFPEFTTVRLEATQMSENE